MNFTGDVGGDWIDPALDIGKQDIPITLKAETAFYHSNRNLSRTIFDVVTVCPQHQFFFLTKNPLAWQKWGRWPENAWVGVSICEDVMLTKAYQPLKNTQAKHKWLSIEPLLGWGMSVADMAWTLKSVGISFVVIGCETGLGARPCKIEWIESIVRACDEAGVKVWLKNKTKPLIEQAGMGKGRWAAKEWVQCKYPILRQELPE